MTGLVWGLEWRIALRRRRLFVLNVAIPLLLVLPVALGGAPAPHAAAVYAVLFVLFGTFGAAIPLVRDAESGVLERIRGSGVAPPFVLFERWCASALLDALQLTPSAAVIVLSSYDPAFLRAGPLLLLAGTLVLSLFAANLAGLWVGLLARSLAETALFAAVASLLLLHASGVFRTPETGSVAAAVEAAAPFRLLHELFLQGLDPSLARFPPSGGGTLLAALLVGGFFTGLTARAALARSWDRLC